MSIDHQISEIRRLDKEGKEDAALDLIKNLISEFPKESRLWSFQGTLYAKKKIYKEALRSLSKAITLSPEGIFYFQRGRYNLTLGNVSEAIIDFNYALSTDNYNDITFTQELYFHRAEALIKLKKKQEALSDIAHIPDGYQTWTSKLRSKADLLSECDKIS